MPFTPRQLPSGRYQGGFKHPVTKRIVTKTFDYDYEAEAWAIIEEDKARKQLDGPTSEPEQPAPPSLWHGPTIAEYAASYLARRSGTLANQTIVKYRAWIAGLDKDVVGKTGVISARRMGLLKRSEIQQWMTDSVNAGVTNASVNDRLQMIRRLYKDLIAEGDAPIQRDPTHGLKLLPTDEDDDRILTYDEEREILAAAGRIGGRELQVAIMVGLDAGLRWQEVYALRPAALTDSGQYLWVTNVIERGRNTLRPYTKGGNGEGDGARKRPVPTTERIAEALTDLSRGKGRHDLLFPSPEGKQFDYHNHRNRLWTPTLYEIGLANKIEVPTKRIRKYGPDKGKPYMRVRYEPEFGFHALRHTYGTRLSDANVPRKEIAILMGHADERTTGRYIHPAVDGRRLELVRAALRHAA